MTFVSVMFLWGILGIAGPITIHLWARPKFKSQPFTMLQFLREGQSESRARQRIRDWIILLFRCGIIALLALLFARPQWETCSPAPPVHDVWWVGLDNSLSMTFPCQGHDLLTELKIQVKKQIRTCRKDTEFHIFLAGSNQWHRHLTQAQALNLVHQMKTRAAVARFDDFFQSVQQQDQERPETPSLNVLLGSDFAPDVMAALAGQVTHTAVDRLRLIPITPDHDLTNIGISAVTVSSVNPEETTIHATVHNTGAQTATRLLSIDCESDQSQEMTLSPGAHQVCTLTCSLPKTRDQRHSLLLALEGQDDFTADDSLALRIRIPERSSNHVLLVDPVTTDRLFLLRSAVESLAGSSPRPDWEIRCITVDQITPAELDWTDTLVMSSLTEASIPQIEPIKHYVAQGKRLVCFMTDWPSAPCLSKIDESRLWPVSDLTPTSATDHPESQPIGNPWTHGPAGESLAQYGLAQMPFKQTAWGRLRDKGQCLWRLQNGNPFVAAQSLGKGISLWVNTSVDTSKSPLAKSPAMVAWTKFLLTPGQTLNAHCPHEAWRDCESIVPRTSPERIEQVTSSLFQEQRSHVTKAAASPEITEQRPLWRVTAWVLLGLVLMEPLVAERMKRP